MINFKTGKVWAALLLVIYLIITLLIFAILRGYAVVVDDKATVLIGYFSVFLGLLIAICLAISILLLTEKHHTIEKQLVISINLKDAELEKLFNQQKQKEKKEEKHDSGINKVEILNRLMPDKKLIDSGIAIYCEDILKRISKELEIVQGVVYILNNSTLNYSLIASYAFYSEKMPEPFCLGEGLAGQVAKSMEPLFISSIPDDYIMVYSGLGKSSDAQMLIQPIVFQDKTIAIIEIASFKQIETEILDMFKDYSRQIAEIIHKLVA